MKAGQCRNPCHFVPFLFSFGKRHQSIEKQVISRFVLFSYQTSKQACTVALGQTASGVSIAPNRLALACEARVAVRATRLCRSRELNKGHIAGMVKSANMLAVGGAHIDRRGRCPAPMCPAPPIPARCARMSAAASSTRCAARCGAASRASLLSMRGGDAAGETRCARHRGGRHRRPVGGVPRPHDAELHGADRPRRRADRRLCRHGALRPGVPQADERAPRCARRSLQPMPSCATPICRPRRWSGWSRLPRGKPVFAIAISPAKVDPADSRCSADLALLFMNRREAAALAGDRRRCAPTRDVVDGLRRAA